MQISPSPLQPRLLFLAGALLAVIAYWGGLAELVNRWTSQEEYSHGFLIPFISLWLLWLRRDALRGSVGKPSWWSIPIIGLALGIPSSTDKSTSY